MNILKSGILPAIVAVIVVVMAATLLFRYYNLVNHKDFLNKSNRTYILEIQQNSTEIKNKIPISLLIADLGLDFELLKWVINNFNEEVLIGLSPYANSSMLEFVSGIKNDVYINIPIKSSDPTQNGGELEIINDDHDDNSKKIISILSISDKIRGVYLKDIISIAEDKKTLKYILDVAHDNHLQIIVEKSDMFQALIDQEAKLNNAFHDIILANTPSIDGENMTEIQTFLGELENNHDKYKHVILFVLPSTYALNEIKAWLGKQDKFSLTRVLNNSDSTHNTNQLKHDA